MTKSTGVGRGFGAGQPLKFKSVAALQKCIDAYFADCDPHIETVTEWIKQRDPDDKIVKDENGQPVYIEATFQRMTKQKPYMITGLALALNCSRQTLLNYENGNADKPEDHPDYDPSVPKYMDTIKKAKLKCEHYAASQLQDGKNAVGSIFNLKNNYDWRDRSEVEEFGEKQVTVVTRGAGSHTALGDVAQDMVDEQPDDD